MRPTFTPNFVITDTLKVLSNLEGESNLNQNEKIVGEKTSKIIQMKALSETTGKLKVQFILSIK